MLMSNWLQSLVVRRFRTAIPSKSGSAHRRRRNLKSRHSEAAQVESLEPKRLLSATSMQLTDISGETGFTVDGPMSKGSAFGSSVRAAGDVNGDGFEDVVIGARRFKYGNGETGGGAFVLFGKSSGLANAFDDLNNLSSADGFILNGIDFPDYAGEAVSGGGDINGDGFDDLVIAAPSATYGYEEPRGQAFVVFGKENFGSGNNVVIELSSIKAAADDSVGFAVTGFNSSSYARDSVSTGGDLNGDGFDDVVIGAPTDKVDGVYTVGTANVIFGKSSGFQNIDLSATDPFDGQNGFQFTDTERETSDGSSYGARIGWSASVAGDVNGDGLDDLLVGAPYQHRGRRDRYEGEAYVVFGKTDFSSTPEVQVKDLEDGTVDGFILLGPKAQEISTDTFSGLNTRLGISVSSGGDVNGDGFDDIVVGADNHSYDNQNPGYDNGGRAYVVFGGTGIGNSVDLTNLSSSSGFELMGGNPYDAAGRSVSITGDLNGDGFDDVLVGAPTRYSLYNEDHPASYDGAAYVIFGASDLNPPASLDSLVSDSNQEGFALFGSGGVFAGQTVSFAGDINGDGFDELMVGTPETSDGQVTFLFGDDFELNSGSQVFDDTDTGNTLTATNGNGTDMLVGGLANDTLISDDGADVLIGGQGDDLLEAASSNFSTTPLFDGGTGVDTLAIQSGTSVDLTSLAKNRMRDLEIVDLDGGAGTADILTLDLATVLAMTGAGNTNASSSPFATNDAHTLTILRDENDTINGIDAANGWTQGANVTIDGRTFQVFTQQRATARIETSAAETPSGSIDGDSDFDANDSFLINIVFLGAEDSLIDFFKGASPLSASEIRTAIQTLADSGSLNVDGDNDTDSNDTFLVNIIKLGAENSLIDFFKGASPLTAAGIRQNVEELAPPETAAPQTVAARPAPVSFSSTDSASSSDELETVSFMAPAVLQSDESLADESTDDAAGGVSSPSGTPETDAHRRSAEKSDSLYFDNQIADTLDPLL